MLQEREFKNNVPLHQQIQHLPQIGVKTKNIWNHHLENNVPLHQQTMGLVIVVSLSFRRGLSPLAFSLYLPMRKGILGFTGAMWIYAGPENKTWICRLQI